MTQINLFICYSKKDLDFLEPLKAYINQKDFPKINVWYDGKIDPGTEWDKTIKDNLEKADIILLLISQYFLNTEYIQKIELKRAFEKHAAGTCKVIPIFTRKCNLDKYPAITSLQGLPEGMRFFSEMGDDADTHYAILQKKIGAIADEIELEKDLRQSINDNDHKSHSAQEIVQFRNNNRIFLSLSPGAEGKKRRRAFLFQVEGKTKYEDWPFEITPGLAELESLEQENAEATLIENLQNCLYSIHIVSDANELREGWGKLQYDLSTQTDQQDGFHRKIIWYLNADIKNAMDSSLAREMSVHANIIGCDYEKIFEVIESFEVERQAYLLQMKKKFSSTRKVLMLYNFNDHDSLHRITLKTMIEDNENISFRFNLPNENLQKEKEELQVCHGALIYYGSADPQWYLMRQMLLLDAQNIRSKAVFIDEPELEKKIRRDVLQRSFITIKGAAEINSGIVNFLNSLKD